MKEAREALLALVQLGIGHLSTYSFKHVEWKKVQTLANEHGLSAVVLDGIGALPDSIRPSKIILLNWIGDVLQSYEQRYISYEKAICSLVSIQPLFRRSRI